MKRKSYWIVLVIALYLISVCLVACNDSTTTPGGTTAPKVDPSSPQPEESSTSAGTIYIDPESSPPAKEDYVKVDEWSDAVSFASAAGLAHNHNNCRENKPAFQGVSGLYSYTDYYASTLHKIEAGASCTFTFTGTAARILSHDGTKNTATSADIYIDNIFYKSIGKDDIQKAKDSSLGGSVLIEVYGLNDAEHKIKIVNSTSGNDSAIYIDRVEYNQSPEELSTSKTQWTISSGDSQMVVIIKDGEPYIAYLGTKASQRNLIGSESKLDIPSAIGVDGSKNLVKISWEYVGMREYSETIEGVKTTGLNLVFRNNTYNLEYNMYIVSRKSINGPFEIFSTFTNYGTKRIRINTGSFASITVSKKNISPTAWYFSKESGTAEGFTLTPGGKPRAGTGIYKVPMLVGAEATAWCQMRTGWNVNGYFPLIYLDYSSQYGVYAALEWNSGRIVAKALTNGDVKLSADMDNVHATDGVFSTVISPGNELDIPSVYIGVYDGDVDDGSNVFKRWFFDCKIIERIRNNPDEPYTQMDMQIGINVAQYGVQSIKWDYGWWSSTGSNLSAEYRPYEGSWIVRSGSYLGVMNSYGCQSLSDFTTKTKAGGVPSITLYLLLHDTVDPNRNPVSNYGEFNSVTHPDWFTNRYVASGQGNLADLGNVECVEYCKDELLSFFKGQGVTGWRTDFEPVSYSSNKANRHEANGTDVQYWGAVGFYEILDHLMDNYSSFRYESCSSGGAMKDFMTGIYSVAINIDDTSNWADMRMTFYDTSYCLPSVGLQTLSNISKFDINDKDCNPPYNTNQYNQVSRNDLLKLGFRSIMLGGIKITCNNYTEEIRSLITQNMTMYNEKIKPLVREAELYHILPRPDGENWDGVMYADPDSKNAIKGLVYLFKPSSKPSAQQHIKLDGLDPNKTYSLVFQDRTAQNTTKTGADLMNTGITVTIEGVGSELIWIYEK